MEVRLHVYSILALDGRWSASRSGPCNPEETAPKTQGTVGLVHSLGKRGYLLYTSGIEPRFIGRPAPGLFTTVTGLSGLKVHANKMTMGPALPTAVHLALLYAGA